MKKLLFLPLVLAALVGCDDHEPDPYTPPATPASGVRLIVKPMWDGAPFDKYTVYHNVSDYRVQVQMLKMYLSDIELLTTGDAQELSDIELLRLTDGPDTLELDAAPGDYSGIRFGIGVPDAVNHGDPTQYAADHPLSTSNGMHWTWAEGYRFVVFDGRFDTITNGVGLLPELFSIHTGMDTCFRDVEFGSLPVQVPTASWADVVLEIDVSRFFYTNSDTVDLATDNQAHGTNIPLATRLSDCVVAAISAP